MIRATLAALVLLLAAGIGEAIQGAIDPPRQELSYVTADGDELYRVPDPTAVPPPEDWTDHGPCHPDCIWWRELNPTTHLWTLHRGPSTAMPPDARQVNR